MNINKNGVDVNNLVAAVDAMKSDRAKAQLKFRTHTTWLNGAHSRTKIKDFTIEADEPAVLLGSNKAPNAVELVLAALGSCLSVGFAYAAAARGIDLQSMEFDIEGDLDLQGFLGISDEVRPGYERIRVSCKLKSDAPRDKIKDLIEYVVRTSPVTDIIRNPVPVTISLE